MIPRITRGSSAVAALAYDFGPGRREEHVDARTVAGTVPGHWRAQAALIDATVAARPRVEKGIWRTSLRAAPTDRVLTDAEWGAIAERYIIDMGVAEHPWTATRHGDDHIHLTVSRVSWTGKVLSLHRDFPKAQAACRAIEAEHHLIDASTRYDKTRPQVVHGEREYAARRGLVPEREQLRVRVEEATSAAAADLAQQVKAERARTGPAVAQEHELGYEQGQGQGGAAGLRGAFEARLDAAGVVYRANVASTGKVSGYSYGLAGHTDATGAQVFFKGSQLGKAHAWAATTKALEVGIARGVAEHLTQSAPIDRQVDLPVQAPAARAASIDVQLERVREARRQRAAAAAEQSAGQSAAQRQDQPEQRPDTQQHTRRPGELVSPEHRERLRAEHEVVRARVAELDRAVRAAERDHVHAQQVLTTAQRDLQAVLRDCADAGAGVLHARGDVSRAAGDLQALRTQVAQRSWLGRARQQLAEDWGAVTNAMTAGRAGTPRGQAQAQMAAAESRLAVAQQHLGGRLRVLESVEARVSAARDQVAAGESAVAATRQVSDRAQVAYGQAVMRPTEYEQLIYREYLAANPEAARRRQEALDPTSAVNRARRHDRSPGPGQGPDRSRGFGR